uniref:Uncharacterized protein n=1 Tax=Avena sativa TaxID=4498 RepID=A0ACD5VSB9_AVESA
MGNCAAPSRHRHAGESWADDDDGWDWEEASSSSEDDHHHHRASEEDHASEVTIRITKRQLHELMERKAPSGSSGKIRQLLEDIINSGEVHVHHHDLHREAHWRPALQSIPEAGESSVAPCVS